MYKMMEGKTVSIPNRDFTNFDPFIEWQKVISAARVSIPNRDFTNFDRLNRPSKIIFTTFQSLIGISQILI